LRSWWWWPKLLVGAGEPVALTQEMEVSMSTYPHQGFDQPDPRPRDNLGRFLPHDGDTFQPYDGPDDEPSVDDEDEYGFDGADAGEDSEDYDAGDDGDDGDDWNE
jgi:hypothetical protein